MPACRNSERSGLPPPRRPNQPAFLAGRTRSAACPLPLSGPVFSVFKIFARPLLRGVGATSGRSAETPKAGYPRHLSTYDQRSVFIRRPLPLHLLPMSHLIIRPSKTPDSIGHPRRREQPRPILGWIAVRQHPREHSIGILPAPACACCWAWRCAGAVSAAAVAAPLSRVAKSTILHRQGAGKFDGCQTSHSSA